MKLPYQEGYKIGILGGGQLGRMLIQSGLDFNLSFSVLDPDANAPCAGLAEFQQGKLTDYDTVLAFGRKCDLITIEIEHVNVKALYVLQAEGKRIYPQPELIELIQDKRLQKQFYVDHGIPTAEFVLISDRADAQTKASFLPAVNKLGRDGYDGKGVQVIRTEAELVNAFDSPGLLEKLIPFEKEISVIVARNANGDLAAFPSVEMEFHPTANLVEFLFAPANLSTEIANRAIELAKKVITELKLVGILAVEMFVLPDGSILVNEMAPRPHNSGHQTIEANVTSQYEQHLRSILGWPLGETTQIVPAAMVNLLGEAGFEGGARYVGLEQVIQIPGVHIHLYGKKMTKPFRKMGHVTITGKSVAEVKTKAALVKSELKVKA